MGLSLGQNNLHVYGYNESIKGILLFLQVWWFTKRKNKAGIEALIQCLVLVLENPFDVMPCINPLSIVRYTMGDKSLSDHLFRLRPENILYIQMSNYAVFLKGGVGRESVSTLNTYILYTTLNFLQEGLIYLFPNIHCHLSVLFTEKKKLF